MCKNIFKKWNIESFEDFVILKVLFIADENLSSSITDKKTKNDMLKVSINIKIGTQPVIISLS